MDYRTLPHGVKEQVRKILRTNPEAVITHDNGVYRVVGRTACTSSGNGSDSLTVRDSDVYTIDERIRNYVEAYGVKPGWNTSWISK